MDGGLAWYARYAWRAAARGRVGPLFYGVALTDRCNLRCSGCRIPSLARPDLTWQALERLLRGAYARGFRELYFSGGEPLLWRDGARTVEDGVRLARRLGFYHVHLYTNGTLGLQTSADLVWVSVDGLPATYRLRRGDHFAPVEAAIRAPGHPQAAVLYVVDRDTRERRASRSCAGCATPPSRCSASCSTSRRRTTVATGSFSTPRSGRR